MTLINWGMPLYSLGVIVNGSRVKKYKKDDKEYVMAKDGSKYVVEFSNHTPNRVLANITVDGRSVIDGELGNLNELKGYIVQPHCSIKVEGWRESLSSVGEFVFTKKKKAYSAQKGTEEECGVIACAVYKDKETVNTTTSPYWVTTSDYWDNSDGFYYYNSGATVKNLCVSYASNTYSTSNDYDAVKQHAGTGYGKSIQSKVEPTKFEAEKTADKIVRLYYDFEESLKNKGIIRDQQKEIYEPSDFPLSFCKPPTERA